MKTLLQDRTNLRDRLNEPAPRRWSDANLNTYINEGAQDIARRSESLLTIANINVTLNVQSYTMPTDMLRVNRVEYQATGQPNIYPLEWRDFNNMDQVWWTAQTIARSIPQLYTMWGFTPTLKITLYPTPAQSGQIHVYYYRLPAVASADGDTVEVPQGWDDLVVDYAEYMALRKDGDARWQEAKGLYEEHVERLFDMSRRWTDQQGMITTDNGYLPSWLWDENFPF